VERDGKSYSKISISEKQKYFCEWGWTDFWMICPSGGFIELAEEIFLCASNKTFVAPASEPGPIRRVLTIRHEG
jgi:hypothetical protein